MEKTLFSDKLQQTFQLTDADPAQALTLIEIQNLTPAGEDAPRGAPFSLLFRGAADSNFEQGVYRLRHQKMEEFSLFLVPIGPGREGMCYEAIFN